MGVFLLLHVSKYPIHFTVCKSQVNLIWHLMGLCHTHERQCERQQMSFSLWSLKDVHRPHSLKLPSGHDTISPQLRILLSEGLHVTWFKTVQGDAPMNIFRVTAVSTGKGASVIYSWFLMKWYRLYSKGDFLTLYFILKSDFKWKKDCIGSWGTFT